MGSTEPVAAAGAPVERLHELAPATFAMLQDLVVTSHWNQVEADWRVFFASGTIYAIRDGQGRIVASGAVLPMGASASSNEPGVAWISMILVLPEHRGRGLGRKVFDRCVEAVHSDDRVAMLDATPAGEALYRQFGFEVLWRLTRWRREARPASLPELPRASADLERLATFDAQALGFSRPAVLAALVDRPGSRVMQQPSGFAILREGRVAHHIGPMVAPDEAQAIALLRDAASRCPGPLFIDVPDERPLLREALAEAGFVPQRGFARMALAPAAFAGRVPPGQPHFIHAVAGPEFA